MTPQLPSYIRLIAKKLSFLSIPNLGMLIIGLAVMAFFAQFLWGTPIERFMFDPERILEGEYWRLFAFPSGLSHPLWLLFYCLYVYYLMQTLEASWGTQLLTFFVTLCYITSAAAAFIINQPVSIWYYVILNCSLAFGTLFPDIVFYLFFIIPVKAKWLAILSGVILLLKFIFGGLSEKGFLLLILSPYLLFFGPFLYQKIKLYILVQRNRRRLK